MQGGAAELEFVKGGLYDMSHYHSFLPRRNATNSRRSSDAAACGASAQATASERVRFSCELQQQQHAPAAHHPLQACTDTQPFVLFFKTEISSETAHCRHLVCVFCDTSSG